MSDNIDLDFQDYTPMASGDIQGAAPNQQPQVLIKIPSSTSIEGSKTSQKGSSKNLLNLLQNVGSASTSSEGISSETLQQMLWLSEKQRSKHQRESIAASGSWGLGYFAQYFDVTAEDVLQRIVWSAVPLRKMVVDIDGLNDSDLILPLNEQLPSNKPDNISERRFGEHRMKRLSYMERFIQSRPDFYGPFWISTTLVFAIAIFSNIVRFSDFEIKEEARREFNLSHHSDLSSLGQPQLEWHYSMDGLNASSSVVIFYVTLLPTLLWFLFWFRGCARYYTITETTCAYGYSLSIFIPVSALLIIQASLFRYILIFLASASSGLVLGMSFLPIIKSDPNPAGSYMILVIIGACQLLLAYIIHRILLI